MAVTATTSSRTKSAPLTMSLEGKPAEISFPDIKTLRAAIPEHCFNPSTSRSLGYLARDIFMAGTLAWAGVTFIPAIPDFTTRTITWIIYGFVQGLVCTGIWILGHEAGHGSFSKHRKLNDAVGLLTHSSLLVPYFSWKFSHARHHQFTGHMEKDMVFAPSTRADHVEQSPIMEALEDTPVYQFLTLLVHQVFGWPFYLMTNISAGNASLQDSTSSWFRRSHFDPFSAVFRPSEAPYIFLSDVGICAMLWALYCLSGVYGTSTVVLAYAQPYFWVHHWLIAITYLHHTHLDVPHYDAENWTFVKGALATIDRDFGFIGKHLFHGIIEMHVVHHLFSRIPFYYAEEACDAIRPLLGDLYYRDDRNFLVQLWSTFTQCKFVEADEGAPGTMKWVQKVR